MLLEALGSILKIASVIFIYANLHFVDNKNEARISIHWVSSPIPPVSKYIFQEQRQS